jgi:hypothetical protein
MYYKNIDFKVRVDSSMINPGEQLALNISGCAMTVRILGARGGYVHALKLVNFGLHGSQA